MAVPTTKQKRAMNYGGLLRQDWQLGDRLQYLGTDGLFTAGFADTTFAATNQSSITIDNDSSTGTFVLSVNSAGTDHAVTLKAPVTTQAVTLTLPDVSADTLVSLTATQTLTGKTLTSPTINGATIATSTLTTPTIADFTNATHDHSNDAGGGALSVAVSSTGTTNNTFDVDSDNTTGVLRLQTTTGGTANTVTVKNSTTTQDVVLTLPDIAAGNLVATGGGITGYIQLNGSSSGAIKIAPIASGSATATIQNQAVSASTITLPSATCTLPGLGLTNTFSAAQAITSDDTSDGVVDLLTLTHSSSDNNATALDGVGVSFQLENATGTSTVEEWASVDVISTTITNGSEDGDIVVKLMAGGTVTEVMRIDSSDQTVNIGQNGTDADNVTKLRIYPVTASRGSLILSATAHASADYATTITNASDGAAASTITLPNATCTLPGLGLANTFTAAQAVTIDDANNAAVVDLLTLTHTTSGSPGAGIGGGLAFQVEDAGGAEEQGSIDFALTTVTDTQEDCDIVFKANLNGDIQQVAILDASDQSLTIGQASTDADGIYRLRIYPVTTSRGSLVLAATAHASADYATTITNATDSGAAVTLTLPNATSTLSGIGLAETFSGIKTFTAVPVVQITDSGTNTVTDVMTFTHVGGTPAAGLGLGLSFIVENATDATTQVASIDFVNTNASCTKVSLDTDMIFSAMLAGTVTPMVTFDASAQEVVIGQDATDANGMHALRIWPLTEAKGSILIQPADNTGDDTITITNGNTSGDITITLPTSTCTLPGLGIANVWTGTADFQGNISASTGDPNVDFSGSSGTFKTTTGEATMGGNVTISGTKTFTTGTGAVTLNGDVGVATGKNLTMAGASTFTTGTGTVTLAGDVTISSGKSVTMSGAGTFTTGSGAVALNGTVTVLGGIDTTASAAMTIAAATASSLTLGATDIVTTVQSSALILDTTAAGTIQIAAVGALKYDDAAITSFAGAEATAGKNVYIETQDGGAATTTGSTGGLLSIKTGDGSAGLTSSAGAAGGAITIATGAGGGSATGTPAASGNLTIATGTGGATSTSGNGANAGTLALAGGTGGEDVGAGAIGGIGGAITITGGTGGAGATGGAGGAITIDGGAVGAGGSPVTGAISIGPTNSSAVAIGRTAATTTLNGAVKGEAEGYMTHTLVVDASASEINTGHVLVTVPAGLQFQLVDLKQIAIGGAAATATAVTVAGSATLTSTVVGTLTQSTLVNLDTVGVTLLADGASFAAQTDGTDISVGKTGGALDGCTSIRFVISYILI